MFRWPQPEVNTNESLCSPSGHGKGERWRPSGSRRRWAWGALMRAGIVLCWDSHACPWREGKGDKALSDEVSNGSALPHIRLFTCSRVKLMRCDLRQRTQRCLQSYLKGLLETGVEMVALRRGEGSCLWGWDGAGWLPPSDEREVSPLSSSVWFMDPNIHLSANGCTMHKP